MLLDPPPPPGPEKPPTPFVSDTLYPLAGGPFVVRQNLPWDDRYKVMTPAMQQAWGKLLGPGMIPAGQMIRPDTVEVYRGAPDKNHTLTHESGHVWHERNVAPEVMRGLFDSMDRFEPKDEVDAQFARGQNEYAAEAFSRALNLLRKTKGAPSEKDLAKLERGMPGVTGIVQWMLTQPPFAK
jgi:hypothetical protein